jgi:hypothetical protein
MLVALASYQAQAVNDSVNERRVGRLVMFFLSRQTRPWLAWSFR